MWPTRRSGGGPVRSLGGSGRSASAERTVNVEYWCSDLASAYGPTVYAPQTFMVGAGQEPTVLLEGITTFNVDFPDTVLDPPFDTELSGPTFSGSAFNVFVFTSTAFPSIFGVTVAPTTNLAGFD